MRISTHGLLRGAVAAFALSATMAAPALAGGGGSFVGGVVGGIIGGAIGSAASNAANRPPQRERVIIRERTRTVRPRSTISSYQREQNRNVQTALNYFGFAAGSPDGVLGRRSRSAIGQYQATLGFPATGHLSDYERTFLISSHARAMAGGVQTAALMSQHGGPAGLLRAYHGNQAAGALPNTVLAAPVAVAPAVVAPGQPPQIVINNNAAGEAQAATPGAAPKTETVEVAAAAPESEDAPAGLMPSFIGGPVEASMASFCNKTNLLSNSNGGMITAASMTDARAALGEQFCLARTYAIDAGEKLTAQVQGVTLAQMQEQCAAFAPTMRDYVAALVAKSPVDTVSDLQTFVIKSGMNPAQLAGNAKICLSIGYRSDNADVALASALVLVGLGEAAYGEMLAHHLAEGFGAPRRLDRAADWYDSTVSALQGGAQQVVAPGMTDRAALLKQAALRLRGGDQATLIQPAPPQDAVLPSFSLPGAEAQQTSN